MTTVTVERDIAAPREIVFGAVSDIENLHETNPDIVGVEFLTEQRSGVGTRFVETRRMGKREMKTELDVTEYVENERIRMVADSHGTVWDTVFTVEPVDGKTRLRIAMDARPHKLLPKLLNPLMQGMFRKGMAKHLEVVAAWCETAAGGQP